MKHLLPAALLLWTCLLAHPASSQVPRAAPTPAPPLVVFLARGTTLRRPLIGLDTAYYQRLRRAYTADTLLLGLRAIRIMLLERRAVLADTALAHRATALRRTQAALGQQQLDFTRLQAQTQLLLAAPPRRPLLLDAHTYWGAALGAAATVALRLLLH